MRPIDNLTKKDAVAEAIRVEILYGRFTAGSRLVQRSIANKLGVSATPVREAFGVLEAEGYLVTRPHRGVVVTRRDFGEVEDNYEIRAALEEIAVKRGVRSREPEALAELRRGLKDADDAMRVPDLQRFRRNALLFHEGLAQLSGSSALSEMLALLRNRCVFHPPLGSEGMRRVQKHHKSILNAISRGDVAKATAALRRHLEWNLVLARLAQNGSATLPLPRRISRPFGVRRRRGR